MKKLNSLCIGLFLVFVCSLLSSSVYAQQNSIQVNGKIIDASELPLAGVTVSIQGTTKTVSSDADGNYSIEVPNEKTVLVFNYIGFKTQEIIVGKRTLINVTLEEDVLLLDELVVVGYGSIKKSDMTGAVTSAKIEDFKDSPNISILESLQGTVPGVMVGASTGAGGSPSIQIRGKNTLSGSTSPLIVLDGVVYRGSIIDININDVQSIDILKDASSKAIYGSQAANGVMIITTIDGKRESKPTFNFSSYYSASEPVNAYVPLDRDGYIAKMSDIYWDEAYAGPDYLTPVDSFDPTKYWDDRVTQGYLNGTDTDWLDLVTQTPFIYNVNASMRGNTNKLSYFLSAGYVEEKAYAKNDDYTKINLRGNFDNKVTDWLTVGMQTFVSSSDYSGSAASLRDAYITPPLVSPYNEDGSLNLNPFSNDPNPLISIAADNEDVRLNLMGTFYADVKIPFIKGLSYKATYSVNYRSSRYAYFSPYGLNNTGSASKSNSSTQDQSFDNILTYAREFNDKHSVNATFVYGYEERGGEDTGASTGDFTNPTLGYNSLESGNVEQHRVTSGAWDEYSLYQMLRLNYSYNSKYMATVTVRRDGFSGFGSEKKFGIFPSAALAWVASNEAFLKDVKWLDYLKLRLSYGASGNRTAGRYSTLATVSGGYGYLFGDGSASSYVQSISKLANNELGWETTVGTNIGLDFTLFNNRLSGSVDYYQNNTHDILYNVSIPSMTGFSSVTSNIGKVANNGLEISLTSVNIDKKDFKWTTTVNYARNRNEIVSILGLDDDGDGVEDDLISSGLFIGEPIGTVYNYRVEGLYQIGDEIPSGYYPGNYILADLNGDGQIKSADDREILGYTDPAYTISIQNNLSYKNWDLSFFINSIQGGDNMYLGSNNAKWSEYGWHPGTAVNFNFVEGFDYWTPSNPDATNSGLRYADPIDGQYLYQDRSFIRLQDVSLSYNVPSKWLKKMNISNLRVYASGKNLLTITDWEGMDPELGVGFSLGSYPLMRSYTFGVNLTF